MRREIIDKRNIIDNQKDNYTLSHFLNNQLKSNRNFGELDISSGYFNVRGYGLIRESLWGFTQLPNFSLRLLLGREAINQEYDSKSFEQHMTELSDEKLGDIEAVREQNYESSIGNELDYIGLNEKSAQTVDDLIKFLRHNKVQVRNNKKRFNHSKCYIFDDAVVVGSSNLTAAGLMGNVELNAVMYQQPYQQEVKEWFDRRWNESEDVKEQLIKILEESKFGLPLEPYKMYIKLLYEYYRSRLEELEKGKYTRVELADFQRDAVVSAFRIIDKYGGVIIADSTGLGKTHIGMSLLREFTSVRRNRVLLIAPRQVLDAVWEPRLLEESIKTKNESLESTGTTNFDPTNYLNYDIVIIDESQNYRSPSTKRYNKVMKVISGGKRKHVILLTATPVNNSLMDLYNQLNLITAGDDTHFADLGITDLRNYFVKADKKQLASGIEDIIRLLDEVMIRRTRNFIKENYPDATLNNRKVSFPERRLTKVEYSLTNIFGADLYKQVIETIDNLHMVPYRIASYKVAIDEKEKEEVENLAALQRYGLLKRFESSIEAIKKSIHRLYDFYIYFEKALQQKKVLNSKKFQDLLSEFLSQDDEMDEEGLFEEMSKIELDTVRDLEITRMQGELKQDLKLLKSLRQNLDNIEAWNDTKLNELKLLLKKEKVFETGGKKAVIFSQFVDTARYIANDLKSNIKDKKILLLTGQTNLATRKKILQEFAPKSNNPENKLIEEADILVASDVLSEGQNLQDANYAINYDLPWNPMKIVQRVGRIDRLTSEHPIVTSAVFFPEKELEDELGLLVKLTRKIQKAAGTVGIESTILGEKASPKTFNAFDRIKKEDASLLDDMERSAELLPETTPFQEILSYLKKAAEKDLKVIPYGRRSGKISEGGGVILCYKEKAGTNSPHLLFYDYKQEKFDHINDITWIFKILKCKEEEPLKMPFEGFEIFKQMRLVDEGARQEILQSINAPFEAKKVQKIKAKYQRELYSILYGTFRDGKISHSEVAPVFKLLIRGSYSAWEDEFKEIYETYQKEQNIHNLIASLSILFQKYKIEARELYSTRQLNKNDLILVGCMFLVNPKSNTF